MLDETACCYVIYQMTHVHDLEYYIYVTCTQTLCLSMYFDYAICGEIFQREHCSYIKIVFAGNSCNQYV